MFHDFTFPTLRILSHTLLLATVITEASLAVEKTSFEKDVQPLITAHCVSCHGFEDYQGNLDLRTFKLMLQGGNRGAAIVRGSAADSLLYQKISTGSMPPEGQLPLTPAAIATIGQWLNEGAITSEDLDPQPETLDISQDDRNHWAFRQEESPLPPTVKHQELVQTPIDRFVLDKLEAQALHFTKKANPRTFVRRIYLDLLGLPPTPEDALKFEQACSSDEDKAYDELVGHLLESPQFGERWGRHWLDAAGYVDTIGDDTDQPIAKVAQDKWRYRDYVITSLNTNKPFDQFITEQLAGDELFDWRSAEAFNPEQVTKMIATTFLRSAADETLQNELNTADMRHEVLQRTMEVTINNLLGLTMKCARCHTHKYDPISHDDYYRLLACFTPSLNPQAWLQPADRELPDISPKTKETVDSHNQQIEAYIGELNQRIGEIQKPVRARLQMEKYRLLPEQIHDDLQKAIAAEPIKRGSVQKYLVEKLAGLVNVTEAEIIKGLSEQQENTVKEFRAEIATENTKKKSWGTIQAIYDIDKPPATYLLERGDYATPLYEVPAGVLSVLDGGTANTHFSEIDLPHSSGRRLGLAKWMTHPDSPAAGLLARVIVNRVWQYLFGRGIVESSDNFGFAGSYPSHPELLDWLAADFIKSGWNYKALIRQIVSSSVYQQDSFVSKPPPKDRDSQPQSVDPGNFLLWKMPLRQLESEAVRDSILSVSGKLDLAVGGPPVMTTPRVDGFVVIQSHTPDASWRRSMYLLQRRRYHESLLEAFGQPELTTNCTQRAPSAIVSQSLTLLNDTFLFDCSRYFAERVLSETDGSDMATTISRSFEIAFCRLPTDEELLWSTTLLEQQRLRYQESQGEAGPHHKEALRHLCHMLLCANEFIYVP
ncbi:MAG: PSD1 and planctomycete cytochrome C domain-containing protein [Pirellulaceae bacterium]|nr:PSD1 and planctomycete cytochrome C domain-containing protein [Pirellulaceae bacterium]